MLSQIIDIILSFLFLLNSNPSVEVLTAELKHRAKTWPLLFTYTFNNVVFGQQYQNFSLFGMADTGPYMYVGVAGMWVSASSCYETITGVLMITAVIGYFLGQHAGKRIRFVQYSISNTSLYDTIITCILLHIFAAPCELSLGKKFYFVFVCIMWACTYLLSDGVRYLGVFTSYRSCTLKGLACAMAAYFVQNACLVHALGNPTSGIHYGEWGVSGSTMHSLPHLPPVYISWNGMDHIDGRQCMLVLLAIQLLKLDGEGVVGILLGYGCAYIRKYSLVHSSYE